MRRHNWITVTAALQRSDSFVMRAAEVLYYRQTQDERVTGMSVWVNWLGYNRADSETMTAIVEDWLTTGYVDRASLAIARHRVRKYAKQLARHANGERVHFGPAVSEALGR